MIENTNDLMSILVIIAILLISAYLIFRVISIKVTARHLRDEADYYDLRKNDTDL